MSAPARTEIRLDLLRKAAPMVPEASLLRAIWDARQAGREHDAAALAALLHRLREVAA
jgi:hypothetical protein